MSYQSSYRENRRAKGNGEYTSNYQKRQAWTPEEDEILKQQVARLGTHCWPDVASGLAGRTSKACSLRWRCFLSPTIIRPNEEPFSQWEIAVIVLTQKMFGNKWNDIANYLPMRCNNDIKNHFNLYLKDKQQQVTQENTYLRAGYDLPSLLANEPQDVQQRRERLEKDRVSCNNFDHGPSKNPAKGGMSSFLRRALPAKPKPAVAKYHPYHMGASAAVLAAAGQHGGATRLALTRSGSGPALLGDGAAGSPGTQLYATFAAAPRPHSAHSMGAMDSYAMGGGIRGLPSSLLYTAGMGHSYAAPAGGVGQSMMQNQLPQQHNATNVAGIKQEQMADSKTTAAGGPYAAYNSHCNYMPGNNFAAGSSYAGLHSGMSSSDGGNSTPDWQFSNSSSPAVPVSAHGCEQGVVRMPSRLQHVGHPELPDIIMGHSASMEYVSLQQVEHQQQQGVGAAVQSQAASVVGVGLPAFDKMPSLPDPNSEPCMFDGCDGDGTSLRGIFSSDDGEHPPVTTQRQQPLAVGAGKLQHQSSGGQLNVGTAAVAAQHGSPPHQPVGPSPAAYTSPGSFTSGGSPAHFQQLQGLPALDQPQQQQQPANHLKHAKLHLDINIAVVNAAYDSHVVAGGDRGALSAPCTVTAAYSPNAYGQQQQQRLLPQGAFSQASQGNQQLSYWQSQQHQQQQQLHQHVMLQQQGKCTPFGHIENQQQHIHHICQDQYTQHSHCAAAVGAGMHTYASGNSSHHLQLLPVTDTSSPSTLAGSAAAAVARGCALAATGPHSWGSSPTSVAAAVTQQQQQQQQQEYECEVNPHALLEQGVSEDLGQELEPLSHLLDSDDNDQCHHGGHELADGTDCELLLSDGDFDHADFALPGLHKTHETELERELELMAASVCW